MDLDDIYLDIENLTDEQLSNLNNLYNKFKRHIEDYIHKRGYGTKLAIYKDGTKNIINYYRSRDEVSYTEFCNAIVNFLKETQPSLNKDTNAIEDVPDLRITLETLFLKELEINLLENLSKRIYKIINNYKYFKEDCKKTNSLTYTSRNLYFNRTYHTPTHNLYQTIAELIDFLYKRDTTVPKINLYDYLSEHDCKLIFSHLKYKETKEYYKSEYTLFNLTTNNKKDEKQRTSTNEHLQISSELVREQERSNAVGKTTKIISKASESRLGVGNRLNGGSSRKLSKGTIQGGNRILTSESLNS